MGDVTQERRSPLQPGQAGKQNARMAQPWINTRFHRIAGLPQARGECGRVAGQDHAVPPAMQEQGWRLPAAFGDEMDRLGKVFIRCSAEDFRDHPVVEGQEIVRPGKADPARKTIGFKPHGVQIAGIERQHGGVIGAGGMTHEQYAARIAAIAPDIFENPGHGSRAILQKSGKPHLRIQPVIRDDDHKAEPRERRGGEAVIPSLTMLPGAAVEKQNNGQRLRGCRERQRGAGRGRVDIELLPDMPSERDVADDAQARGTDGFVEQIERTWQPGHWPQ